MHSTKSSKSMKFVSLYILLVYAHMLCWRCIQLPLYYGNVWSNFNINRAWLLLWLFSDFRRSTTVRSWGTTSSQWLPSKRSWRKCRRGSRRCRVRSRTLTCARRGCSDPLAGMSAQIHFQASIQHIAKNLNGHWILSSINKMKHSKHYTKDWQGGGGIIPLPIVRIL